MIAACSLAGLYVHFLDLIALPITITAPDLIVTTARTDEEAKALLTHLGMPFREQ